MSRRLFAVACLFGSVMPASVCRAATPIEVSFELNADGVKVKASSLEATADAIQVNRRKDKSHQLALHGNVRVSTREFRAMANSADITFAADETVTQRFEGNVKVWVNDVKAVAQSASFEASSGKLILQGADGKPATLWRSKDGAGRPIEAERIWCDLPSNTLKVDADSPVGGQSTD